MMKEVFKHRDELNKASRVISELGFIPNDSMCCDKPDICIPSKENRQIGIEVVAYSTHRYEKSENALYKILKEYIEEHLDKNTDKRYEINVFFTELEVPVNINYRRVKRQIFDELDSLLLPHHSPIDRQYIESIIAMENPGVRHSSISCCSVVLYDKLDEKTLLECIRGKEQKLKSYKSISENKTIMEYYLVIFFPTNEHAELRGYVLPETFTTDFTRIYLVDPFNMNQIK